jgi:hypothetical protein
VCFKTEASEEMKADLAGKSPQWLVLVTLGRGPSAHM